MYTCSIAPLYSVLHSPVSMRACTGVHNANPSALACDGFCGSLYGSVLYYVQRSAEKKQAGQNHLGSSVYDQ